MADSTEIIIGIAIFMLITIFLVVIIVAIVMGGQIKPASVPSSNTGTLLSPCTTTPCNTGLVCDGTSFVCKLGTGLACSTASECVTGLICSGICVTGAVGGLNEYCPCNDGYACVAEFNSASLCKGLSGAACILDSDCVSTVCDNDVCTAGFANAYPCTSNVECESNNCNNGFCQPQGVTTGVLGSACASPCVGFIGAECVSAPGNPLTCECTAGPNVPGVCSIAQQGILAPCSTSLLCADVLVCYDTQATVCTAGITGCACEFPYTDPNIGNTCIPGMTSVSGTCLNNINLGCSSTAECASGTCNGNAVLAEYTFTLQTATIPLTNLGTNYLTATTTTLSAIPGLAGTSVPYKLFATSNDGQDTIYVVDHAQGLVSLVYDTSTSTVITPWTQLIPYTTTNSTGGVTIQNTLIDASYNGQYYIVAFATTVTTGTGSQSNDTVYYGTDVQNLGVFNFQTGSGLSGTQYTTADAALAISYIDISIDNDVLISTAGSIYVKQSLETKYTLGVVVGGPMSGQSMTGTTGPARFYVDSGSTTSYNNIAFVAPFQAPGTLTFDNVLQFSGVIAGASTPTDRFKQVQYQVFDFSLYSNAGAIANAGIVMLCQAYLNTSLIDDVVSVNYAGTSAILPYRIDTASRCVATANRYYIMSPSSCT